MWAPIVTRIGGLRPAPSDSTTSGGISMPAAVLPLDRITVRNRIPSRTVAMFDHVTLRVGELDASARFYDTVLRTFGVARTHTADWLVEWDVFSLSPGGRPEYGPDYYGGFLLDPDGNSAEAVHHDLARDRHVIDHLWIRVADVAAAKRFYATIAPEYHPGYYGAFVCDPDGNNIELVFHDRG